MTSEFSRKVYTIILSVALAFSMFTGSFSAAYALDETEVLQSEEDETGGEETLQADGQTNQEPESSDDITGSEEPASQEESIPADGAEGMDDAVGSDDENTEEDKTNVDTDNSEGEDEETEEAEEKELVFPKYVSRNVPARDLGVNLRTMIGEENAGYAVAQGAATDGTYAYFLMVRSANQKGRVVKTTLDGKLVKAGPVINTHHGNGMTYNSKINMLVAVGYDEWRHELSFIDPDTLTISYKRSVSYPYSIDGVPAEAYDNGIAGIAYVAKYNVYVARSRGYIEKVKTGTNKTIHNIWVFDADSLEAIAHIDTVVAKKYPNVWQSMDADEKYVYYLLSPGSGQPNNIVLCLDWNSENLEPVINEDKKYIEHTWKCNDNGSGEPDAVMTMPITKESEGLFHTVSIDEEGNVSNHFYVSEYKGVQKYKTLTKKEPYKVKWKKVKKKVKWKKVKIKKGKNKGKYKWKYKTKKVWKYKTKYKTVKYKVKDYKARDDYFYDLGVF